MTTPAGVFHGYDFASATSTAALALHSDLSGPPQGQTSGGPTAVYLIDMETGGELLAIVHAQGFTARLMMLDSQGRVIVQSDGLSASDPDSVIDQYLSAGNYSLVVESTGGAGTYALTTSLAVTSSPFQPIPVSGANTSQTHRGGRLQRRRPRRPRRPQLADDTVSVLLGNGDGTFQPPVSYAVGLGTCAIVTGDFTGDGRADLAVVSYRSDRRHRDRVGAAGQRRRHVPAPGHLRGGRSHPTRSVAGDFTGDGRTDLAVGTDHDRSPDDQARGHRCSWATATARSSPTVSYQAGDYRPCDRGGRLQRRRPHRPGRRQRRLAHIVSVLLGNGDGTFQPQVTYAVGIGPTRSRRATSPATAAPTWPSLNQRRLSDSTSVGAAGQR